MDINDFTKDFFDGMFGPVLDDHRINDGNRYITVKENNRTYVLVDGKFELEKEKEHEYSNQD